MESVAVNAEQTHVINTTRVILETAVVIPLRELFVLLKDRGLVPHPGAMIKAETRDGNLILKWDREDIDKQIAAAMSCPLIPTPDPDLNKHEEVDLSYSRLPNLTQLQNDLKRAVDKQVSGELP